LTIAIIIISMKWVATMKCKTKHTHTKKKIIPLSTTLLRNTGRRSYVVQIDYRDMQITALHDTLFSTNFTCC
jgi:hypothetical protein